MTHPALNLDLLRARPDLAAAYTREKLRVAEAVGWDELAYSEAKGPFIEALLRGEEPPGEGA